jgi:SAM-dependent methyltransferase
MRGWAEPYRISVGLGLRQLARRRHLREAVIRIVVPMDPSRYLELPWAARRLSPARGESVLDLASPKLLCVLLARRGARVTSVDQLTDEIERWRSLAWDEPNLELRVADGRALPFADESFDHGSSISVIEHVGGDGGDAAALSELARCVRRGGRVAVTLPYAREAWIEYHRSAAYVDEGERSPDGAAFFQRWYDDAELGRLVGAVGSLEVVERDVVRLAPNLGAAYNRTFPLLVPLGPFYGLLARERVGDDGDVVRLLLERR